MLYNCKIINIEEEEITIKIGEVYITGFTNCSVNKGIGEDAVVDISLYDDLKLPLCEENKCGIERKNNTFCYIIFGTLDICNSVLKSVINFEIDKEELFDYGYLDGKHVKTDVIRLDFDFK